MNKVRIILLVVVTFFLFSTFFAAVLLKTDLSKIGLKLPSANKIEQTIIPSGRETVRVVNEESVVIDVVKNVSSSTVTVGIIRQKRVYDPFSINPYDPFGGSAQGGSSSKEQDIGSGFIVSSDGLILTNKHVVSDTEVKYQVITSDDKKLEVKKIYRDPVNDLAIIKVDPPSGGNFKPIALGDSSKLQVGQFVIAIGTALGEFRQTVTTGVVSGLGRGITAGDPFGGFQERLDNLIQTDAAINPGNSGGPLLNSAGQVIGVNVAVAQGGQNIGFALPINVAKESLSNFSQTGKFSRPYLGIKYKQITRDLALLNDLPEGAYVQAVVNGSPADKAGLLAEDIITKLDGVSLTEKNGGLAKQISNKKVGDMVELTVWRDEKILTIKVTLAEFTE